MKIIKMFLRAIILLILKQCEAAATNYPTRYGNREQINTIESSMDLTVDPCDDFYNYACGNWDNHFNRKYRFTLHLIEINVNIQMADAFNNFNTENKPKFIKEAYNFYKSCKSLKKYQLIKFYEWLEDNDNFGWSAPWLYPKNNSQLNWVQRLAKMRTYNFNEVFLKQHITFEGKYLILLQKPDFQSLTKKNFVDLLESLPKKLPQKDIDHLWQEIEEFEEKLQELHKPSNVEVDSEWNYGEENIFSVKNLSCDWLKDYLKIILDQTQLNDEMEIYIENINYIKALDKILSTYSQRFLCDYLETRFLWFLHIPSPTYFEDKNCMLITRNLMPHAMYWQYEQLNPELKDVYGSIYEMFANIRRKFNNTLSENKHGFNATVVEYLQNKVNNMKLRVNNIPRVDTVATLEKFYQSLNLSIDNFYENRLKVMNFNFVALRNLLISKTSVLDHTYFQYPIPYFFSSPFFLHRDNLAYVPITFLSYPMYSPRLDNVYKYSSVGFLLAHELFHAFDGLGISIDANGITSSINFEDNPSFNASFNCLLNLNPKTANERIADTSGVRYAYNAFFDSHPDAARRTVSLHGSETSMRKMFFLNFAQFFCGPLDTKGMDFDVHGPYRDRVIDALSHFPEFAKEFNCNRSHRFYPNETCNLWD